MLLKGFDVSIECDKVPLPEYEVLEGRKSITCYVPSEAGKTFRIHCDHLDMRTMPRYHPCFDIAMDGQDTGRGCSLKFERGDEASRKGVGVSPTSYKPFVFSKINVVENVDMESLKLNAQHVGTIQLRLYRCTRKSVPRKQRTQARKTSDILTNEVLPEKSKKAGFHHVQLGPVKTRAPPDEAATETYKYTRIDAPESPVATFTFLYRPKAILQAEGIIPLDEANSDQDEYVTSQLANMGRKRTPPHTRDGYTSFKRRRQHNFQEDDLDATQSLMASQPGPSKREDERERDDIKPTIPSQSNGAELRALTQQLQAVQQQLSTIQSQIARVTSASGSQNIKQEAPTTWSGSQHEIVDLTLDD